MWKLNSKATTNYGDDEWTKKRFDGEWNETKDTWNTPKIWNGIFIIYANVRFCDCCLTNWYTIGMLWLRCFCFFYNNFFSISFAYRVRLSVWYFVCVWLCFSCHPFHSVYERWNSHEIHLKSGKERRKNARVRPRSKKK